MSKKEKTKEEYFSLFEYCRNILDIESILYPYDLEYSYCNNFDEKFYKFLDEGHFMTSNQKTMLFSRLKDGCIYSLSEFMEIMIKDFDNDYDDIATLTVKQFESIVAAFFEENHNFAKSLFEDIKTSISDINWEYLFKFVPIIKYEEPLIQNNEYVINTKDLEYLKTAIESLENIFDDDDTIAKEITNEMKKIINNIK